MEALTGTLIYWYMSVGVVVGFMVGLFIKREGISFMANIIWGLIGGVIMGAIGLYMGISDGVLFAFIATWPFLFLINAFHQHHEEDIFGELKHPARVVHK